MSKHLKIEHWEIVVIIELYKSTELLWFLSG